MQTIKFDFDFCLPLAKARHTVIRKWLVPTSKAKCWWWSHGQPALEARAFVRQETCLFEMIEVGIALEKR